MAKKTIERDEPQPEEPKPLPQADRAPATPAKLVDFRYWVSYHAAGGQCEHKHEDKAEAQWCADRRMRQDGVKVLYEPMIVDADGNFWYSKNVQS